MSKLEENLKKYYSSKSLPDEKIDLLLNGRARAGRYLGGLFKIAAAIAVFFALYFGYFYFQGNQLEMRVAKEIAMNHNKQLAVEFKADNLDTLGSKLVKLDFPLNKAKGFLASDYKVLGGRYCSIQGNLAAQLKIENTTNKSIETLYISELKGDLERINPADINMDGVNIRVWKKDGLLYGKASDL